MAVLSALLTSARGCSEPGREPPVNIQQHNQRHDQQLRRNESTSSVESGKNRGDHKVKAVVQLPQLRVRRFGLVQAAVVNTFAGLVAYLTREATYFSVEDSGTRN